MKPYRVHFLIAFMSLALLGIIFLQVSQIWRAIQLSEQNFDTGVNDALNQVVEQLYAEAIKTRYVKVSRDVDVANAEGLYPEEQEGVVEDSVIIEMPSEGATSPRTRKVRIRDSLSIVTEQETLIPEDSLPGLDGQNLVFVAEGPGAVPEDLAVKLRGDARMVKIVSATLQGLHSDPLPVEERVDSLHLDTLLTQALAAQGLHLDHTFMVWAPVSKRLVIAPADRELSQLLESPHHIQLYPYLGQAEKSYLHVHFPDRSSYTLQAVWVQAWAALLFSGIILVTFWLTVRTIFRQKKLSEMKNDFINNMTHELKTPIATISLATDALQAPSLKDSPESMQRYLSIIKEENQRMNRQVERVLQAARFERNEVTLKLTPLNLHKLITQTVHSIELQVRERAGEISLALEARHSIINGDEVHLSNILYNLLDNANKYSPEAPQIRLSTETVNQSLVIRVSDNGIGISKADQSRIFTRFYRVSTGDLHDVKGFGLGLSYVKDIIEAHGGSISVFSQLGKGSTFEVKLPLSEA